MISRNEIVNIIGFFVIGLFLGLLFYSLHDGVEDRIHREELRKAATFILAQSMEIEDLRGVNDAVWREKIFLEVQNDNLKRALHDCTVNQLKRTRDADSEKVVIRSDM